MRFVWGIIIGLVCIFVIIACTAKISDKIEIQEEVGQEDKENTTLVESLLQLKLTEKDPVSYEGYPLFTHMMGFWSTTNYSIIYEVVEEINGEKQEYTLIEKRNPGVLQIELTSEQGKEYYYFVNMEMYECDSLFASATCNTIDYSEVISAGMFLEFVEVDKISDFEEKKVLGRDILCGEGFKTIPCLTREGLPLMVMFDDEDTKYTFIATEYEFPFYDVVVLPSSIS